MKEWLNEAEIFRGLDEQEIGKALRCLDFSTKTANAEQMIIDFAKSFIVGVLVKGAVDVVWYKEDGQTLIIRRILPGDCYLYKPDVHLGVSFTAVEESELVYLKVENLFNPEKFNCPIRNRILENVVNLLARESTILFEKTKLVSERRLRNKILRFLRHHPCTCGRTPVFDRQDLADYLGSERSALSRELSKMERDGLIRIEGRRILPMSPGEARRGEYPEFKKMSM